MKVLHILSELQFSGAELMLYTAADRFKEQGVEVTILGTGQEEGIFAPYFRSLGWEVVHIPFRKHMSYFKELHALIRKHSFDVIHIHTEGAFIYKVLTARLAGKRKIVTTVHNNFLFSGYIKYRRIIHHLVAQRLLKVKFTAISDSVQKTEKDIYHTRTVLINNWIDFNKFNKKDKSSVHPGFNFPTAIRFISVGKCLPEKRHQDILALVQVMKKRNVDCYYVHIGCGELEEAEKKWALDNGIADQVKFISHTDKVADYMAACNFYLMPSLFEGIGNACLEAMAAGLFCIVNDAPGLNSLISDNKTGYVINFSDLDVVADKIEYITKNQTDYARMTSNAIDYVKLHHSPANVDQIISLYK